MRILSLLPLILILVLSSCADESFKPNNLISQDQNQAALEEEALLSGAPFVQSMSLSSGTYPLGSQIVIQVVFSKRVVHSGTHTIAATLNSGPITFTYLNQPDDYTLNFSYNVSPGDVNNANITLASSISTTDIIKDNADQEAVYTLSETSFPAVVIDGVIPNITNITTNTSVTYLQGETLSFTVDFSENMINTNSFLEVNIDGSNTNVPLSSQPTASSAIYSLVLSNGLEDLDGITLNPNLQGVISDSAGNLVNATLPAINTSNINIDTLGPEITNISFANLFSNQNDEVLTITSGTGADEMAIGFNTDCSSPSFVTYNATPSITLNQNSVNQVSVLLRDASGNVSTCATSSITHDNLAPNTTTITVANNASDIASDYSSWNAVSDNGPSGFLRFEYAVSTSTNEADIVTGGGWIDLALLTTYQITSGITLAGGGTYYTLIKSVDNAGNSAYIASAPWNVILSPERTTNIGLANRGTDFIKIAWGKPNDNGTAIEDYIIEYKLSSDSTWITINDGVNTKTNYTLNGLIAETSYDFRVRAFNGTNYGAWSPTLTKETLPNIEFFEQPFKAINIGGATDNAVVSFEDSNVISLNGSPLVTLNRGETHRFTASQFDVLEASSEFFVAGRRGSGSDVAKANMIWATSAQVGQQFYFNHNRDNPMQVNVYAFTASTVTIKRAGVDIETKTIAIDTGDVFSLSTFGSYELVSTGFVAVYTYAAGGGSRYTDPKPLLPASIDILGFPSSRGKLTSGTSGNNYTYIHSNSVSNTGTLTAGVTQDINAQGTNSLYRPNAVRIIASEPVVANSYADSNGNCSAPFVPVSFLKKRFGLNVQAEWVAFASDRATTITITAPGGGTSSYTLTRTGLDPKAPFYGRIAVTAAGTLFESTSPFQTWYEPRTDTGGARRDETVMFGWD
jgi:hypothetical protein